MLDLGEKAHLTSEGTFGGEIAFVAVKGLRDSVTARATALLTLSSLARASTMPMNMRPQMGNVIAEDDRRLRGLAPQLLQTWGGEASLGFRSTRS